MTFLALLRNPIAILLILLMAASGTAWIGWHRASVLKASLGHARAQVAAFQEAARIRQADDARRAQIDARATERDHALQTDPGGDDPLSPYLRRAAGRLWP